MPPRARGKKPVKDQTYTSKPALKQKRLPARRRTVSGKFKRPPLEKRQSTLTQIDFAGLSSRDEFDDISDEDDFEECQPPGKKRRSSTAKGDTRKDRTLTQMEFVKTPKRTIPVEDSEEEGRLSDEEDLVSEALHLTPQSETKALNIPRSPRKILEIADSTESLPTIGSFFAQGRNVDEDDSRDDMAATVTNDDAGITARGCAMLPPLVPRTPKRVRKLAIPSSQTSPTTPLSTQQSPRCPGSGKERSPLQNRSTNIPMVKDLAEDVSESITEARNQTSPLVAEFESAIRETQPIDTQTKKRARVFKAQMNALRNGAAFQHGRRKARKFERGQIIRSSTHVSLVSEEDEHEVRDNRPKKGETQFTVGEETQAMLSGIDLSGEVAQEVEDEAGNAAHVVENRHEAGLEANAGDQSQDIGDHIEEDADENTVFEIGEPQEPLANDLGELPKRTNELDDNELRPQDIYPRESSPELPFDNYEGEARVPSSQNETPKGTRRADHEYTIQNRRVTFSDQLDSLTLPIPQSPTSTAPQEEEPDTQESIDAASAQLIYESQAYAALAASSPIEAEPLPIPTSSPAAPRHSSQSRFRTPKTPRKNTQVQFADGDETQAPSTGRTESLSTTTGTYPKSALKGAKRSVRICSSPEGPPSSPSTQQQQQLRLDPTTPGIFRFLKGPVTASQLIPDSLRSDLDDGIGLPPRWTMDDDDDDDDDDEL